MTSLPRAADPDTVAADPQWRGTLTVADRAAQRLVIRAALDTTHVAPHSRGMHKLSGHSLPQVALNIIDNRVHAALTIAVTWPAPAVDVARAAQRNVIHALHTLGGFDVVTVDVTVAHLSAPAPAHIRVH